MNAAAIATPVEDIMGDGRWMSMHNRFIMETKDKEPDVIFIGDSIIQKLGDTDMWNKLFAPMHALNFGIGGDSTQHVLWRVENGELDQVKPKVIVLLVGTNNFGFTPEQIADGVMTIVSAIRERQPECYIVLPTLLPRGQHPNPLRERNLEVNKLIHEHAATEPKCEVVVIDKGLVLPDGTISHHDMHDYLHLTPAGYQKAFEPVHDLLTQLLTEGEEEKELTLSE